MGRETQLGLATGVGLAVAALTVPYAGIQWGDGLEFAAVSSHLGVAHPPGYPLFTLLGWPAVRLTPSEPYLGLLLLCRLMLAVAGAMVGLLTHRIATLLNPEEPKLAGAVGAASAFALVFAPALLTSIHAVEVYTLNMALVAGMALLLFPKESEGSISLRRLVGAGALLGLALANHLPALSMAPLLGLMALAAMRHLRGAVLLAAIPVVVIPAVLYLTMPLRAGSPDAMRIFWGDPDTTERLLFHMRGGEYGQFQFLSIAPGVAMNWETWIAFFTMRLVQFFVSVSGLLLPLQAGQVVVGGVLLLAMKFVLYRTACKGRRHALWAAGVGAALMLQFAFIATYNIPDIEDYMLGLLVLMAPVLWGGIAILPQPRASVRIMAAGLLAALLTISGWGNRAAHRALPGLFRDRLVEALPEGAAMMTSTDADVYTMLYVQHAEGERLDVAVIGKNFLRFPWYRRTLPAGDTRREAISFFPGPPPLGPEPFVAQLREGFIEPALKNGPLFWTFSFEDPIEVRLLQRHYEFKPVTRLLTDEEWELIQQAGLVNFPTPILYEIVPRTP